MWPVGKNEAHEEYEQGGFAKDIGKLSLQGRDGWYVPEYVLEDYPQAQYYPFLMTEEAEELFGHLEVPPFPTFIPVCRFWGCGTTAPSFWALTPISVAPLVVVVLHLQKSSVTSRRRWKSWFYVCMNSMELFLGVGWTGGWNRTNGASIARRHWG